VDALSARTPTPNDLCSYDVFSVTRADYEKLKQLQREFFRGARALIAASEPTEMAGLLLVNLLGWEPERMRRGQAIGHETFAAGLIDRRCRAIRQSDIQAAATRGDGGGKPCGPAADDEKIGRARKYTHRVASQCPYSQVYYTSRHAEGLIPE